MVAPPDIDIIRSIKLDIGCCRFHPLKGIAPSRKSFPCARLSLSASPHQRSLLPGRPLSRSPSSKRMLYFRLEALTPWEVAILPRYQISPLLKRACDERVHKSYKGLVFRVKSDKTVRKKEVVLFSRLDYIVHCVCHRFAHFRRCYIAIF